MEPVRGRIDCISAKEPGVRRFVADTVATGRDALPRDPAPHVQRRYAAEIHTEVAKVRKRVTKEI